jgi:DNA repair exonuclease SbcCD ATPase subunit
MLEKYHRTLNLLRDKRKQTIKELKIAIRKKKEKQKELKQAKEARDYLQKIFQQIQLKAHKGIATIVSKCLSAVFDRPYTLKIEFERKRGKTEAKFIYYQDGHRVNPRVTSGGVMDVTAMALRLCSIVMDSAAGRKFSQQDEPFKGVSGRNLQRMQILLEVLTKELDTQFLIATHHPELQVGRVINLDEVNKDEKERTKR